MIKTVQMRNCATYSAEGASINDCRKINFFYGPNGSGKSTISNYLSSYSKSSGTPKYSSCDIQWENDSPVEIVVYNKNFRTRHLKEDIAGIFTLGEEADIGQLNTIEKLKDDRNNKGEILSGLEKSLKEVLSEKTHQEAEFKDGIWQKIFKQNEGIFSELFHGLRNSKDRFKEVVVNRFENRLHTNNSSNTKDGLLKKYNQLFSQQLEKYDDIAIPEDKLFSDLKKIEEDPIWSKSIVGNKKVPISQLIDSLNNADWVNEGRLYVRENGVCPFCQQETITKKLKRQLDDFFNGEYESDIQNIETLISEYKEISERLLRFLEDVIDNDVASNIGDISPLVFKTDTDSLKALFKSNLDRMLMKKREASKKVLLDKSYSKLNSLKKTISSINQKIAENNNLVDNVGEEKKALLDAVWVLLVNEQEPLISVYLDKLANIKKSENGINNKIDKIKKELKELDNSILTAEKNITSVQPTIDRINSSLSAYGFTNFKITPSTERENYYQIQRMDGTLATDSLSEGEETFISFLYFMQLAKGSISEEGISSKRILVIDDPISSLDSTVLYIVSSMVKALIKDVLNGGSDSDVVQMFVLTHNVFFHKEASFMDGRAKECNDVNYWIISKDNNVSSIRPYGKVNPIKTSYELLWQELKRDTISQVALQNIMRRIIEYYFGMLGRKSYEEIIKHFDTVEDRMACHSLISWINDGSHSIPDDLYNDSYQDSTERYKRIFRMIFDKTGNIAHYNMMMA